MVIRVENRMSEELRMCELRTCGIPQPALADSHQRKIAQLVTVENRQQYLEVAFRRGFVEGNADVRIDRELADCIRCV